MNERWRLSALLILKEENYRYSDSWTDIYDVGHVFYGHKLTFKEYRKTEQAYIDFIVAMFKYLHVRKVQLTNIVTYDHKPKAKYDKDGTLRAWHNKIWESKAKSMSLSLEELQYVVPLIVRENMWGVFYHRGTRTYIHFGEYFYVYVNSPIFHRIGENEYINPDFENLVTQNGLFIEYEYNPVIFVLVCKDEDGKICRESIIRHDCENDPRRPINNQ